MVSRKTTPLATTIVDVSDLRKFFEFPLIDFVCSVGIDVGACVALQLAHCGCKPAAYQQKQINRELPKPLCAALILQSPAIAPPIGRAAALLRPAQPNEPFLAVRKMLSQITLPTLVAVGKLRTGIDSATVAVRFLFRFRFFSCLF